METKKTNRRWLGLPLLNAKGYIVAALLCFALGSYCANGTLLKPERPILRAISNAARIGLRLMVFMEPPPPEDTYETKLGSDGYTELNHRGAL